MENTQFAIVPETKTFPMEVSSGSDSEKTTLSGHVESGMPQDLQVQDTQHSEMIVITSDNVEDTETGVEALRIQQSQERARRIILQADPEEIEALLLSVQHDTFIISEEEEKVLDFSFLRPASYGSS